MILIFAGLFLLVFLACAVVIVLTLKEAIGNGDWGWVAMMTLMLLAAVAMTIPLIQKILEVV